MIHIKNLVKNIGIRQLFRIDKATISEEDKIALIGMNGEGKTTLLRILSGLDEEYRGSVQVNMPIDYLLSDPVDELDVKLETYSRAGLDPYSRYSPGESQRLKLMDVLLEDRTFLLLDEPNSHLDLVQKEILIDNLNSRRKGYILISHDRDFIARTCDQIWEIEEGDLEIYNGDYDFYLQERSNRRKFMQKEYDNYVSEKKRLQDVMRGIKNQSSKVATTPKRMGNSEARLHKMGGQENKKKLEKQVKAIQSRIDRLPEKEKPKEEVPIVLRIPDAKKIRSKVLVRTAHLEKRFGDHVIFENTNLIIRNDHKVALIGENGVGKTTLLRMILEDENLWRHPKLKIGYYSQLGETIEESISILDNVTKTSIYDQSLTRIVLARLGFRRDSVYKICSVLSDGEKAKVKLAKIMTSDFNYLILDEPTNFLDIRAIEALEELLIAYDRPFIFVTHDRSFINNVADTLLFIEDCKLVKFDGNLSEYEALHEQKSQTLE